MSVFKKLVGFLFEEEEEIEEEGELEEVSFRSEHKEPRQRVEEELPAIKRSNAREHVRVEMVQPQQKPQPKPAPVMEQPKAETHFTTIEITKEDKKPEPAKRRPMEAAQRNRKAQYVEPVKQEFEFTPVISPIFGADETTTQKQGKHAKSNPNVPQNRTTIPSSPKKNPLGTVLSPIYGATELEEFELEAKERIETNAQALAAVETESLPPQELPDFDDVDFDDDIVSVPLEDLLSSEEQTQTSDDLLQFSLFGDDEVVSTEKSEDTYTIKE